MDRNCGFDPTRPQIVKVTILVAQTSAHESHAVEQGVPTVLRMQSSAIFTWWYNTPLLRRTIFHGGRHKQRMSRPVSCIFSSDVSVGIGRLSSNVEYARVLY